MKNRKFSKICLWTMALAMILAAFVGIYAQAEETPKAPEIVSKNVSYEGALHLYYAIPVTENVTAANTVVNVYSANPETDANAELLGSFSGKEENVAVLGGNHVVVRTQGIPAKDIANYVYAQPVSAGVAGKVIRYSVAEYLYERLYVSENVTDLQKKLYNSTLTYGMDAQAVLAPSATPIANYNYVYAYDATIDAEGNNSGLYLDGTALTLSYTGEGRLAVWDLKTLAQDGSFEASTAGTNNITVNATTIVSPSLYKEIEMDNSGETFDTAFKDSARENIRLPDTGKTYYNNNIFAEKASGNAATNMTFGIAKDPKNENNNVLHIMKDTDDTAVTYQSYLTFNAPSTTNFDTVVFETDMYTDFSDKSTSSVHQFDFRNGSTEGVTVLLGADHENLSVRVLGNGVTTGYEKVDGVFTENNWYTLRIEYQIIDAAAGTTETRVYINGELFKTVNYVNTATPLTNVTNMFVRNYGGLMGDIYMDNVTIKKVYAADEARPAYTFDGDTLPAGVTVGGWGSTTKGTTTVNNGQLTLNSVQGYNDTLVFKETETTEDNANTVVWSADIRTNAYGDGAGSYSELTFTGSDGKFRFNIMLRNKNGADVYFKSYGRNPKLEFSNTGALSGSIFNLRLEYYINAETSASNVDIYINNNYIGTMDDTTEGNPFSIDAFTSFTFGCRDGDTQDITFDNVRLYKINKTR